MAQVLYSVILLVICLFVVGLLLARHMEKRIHVLLDWMLAHPRWHYGLDIVRAGLASPGSVYFYLGELEEAGYVECRDDPGPPLHSGYRRCQYRAKGRMMPRKRWFELRLSLAPLRT